MDISDILSVFIDPSKNPLFISVAIQCIRRLGKQMFQEEANNALGNICKVKFRLSQISSYRPGDFVCIPDRVHDVLSFSRVTDEIKAGYVSLKQTINSLFRFQPHRNDDRIRQEGLSAESLLTTTAPYLLPQKG